MAFEIELIAVAIWGYLNAATVVRIAGQRSQRRGDHQGAYRLFLRAARISPPLPSYAAFRSAVTIQAALAAFSAGMPEEAVRCAEKGIKDAPTDTLRMLGHASLAAAYSEKGELSRQLEHQLQALALAEKSGDKRNITEYTAGVAHSHYKQGRLIEAIAASERAENLSPDDARTALLVKGISLAKLGRYAEATAELQKARRTKPHAHSFFEDRSQSTLNFSLAVNYAEAGMASEGLAEIPAARRGFIGDARYQLWCDALETYLFALAGETEKVPSLIASAREYMEAMPNDRKTQAICLEFIAKASLAVASTPQALQLFGQWLTAIISPVDFPDAYFWIGECHERLGNPQEARTAFEKATRFDFETVYTRRAALRLAELGGK